MDAAGIEPAASSLRTKRSTDELRAQMFDLNMKRKAQLSSEGWALASALLKVLDQTFLKGLPHELHAQLVSGIWFVVCSFRVIYKPY